jgi:uncharacterized membrane protein YdjX (TVP38/TMEM64 family)
MKSSGVVARSLLGAHLAGGLVLSVLGTGAVVAGLAAGRELSQWTFLALAVPGLALGVLPSTTLMLSSGVLFGWKGALVLYPGLVAAALPGFVLIRRFFRPEVRELLGRHPAAGTVVARLEDNVLPVATLLRIAPVSTFAWTNAILSASAIGSRGYVASTTLGLLPRLLLLTWAGSSAGDLGRALQAGSGGTPAMVGLGISILALVVLAVLATRVVRGPETD